MEPVDESFLAGLGVHRIPTPVPFLEAGGPANVYVLEEDDGFSLFDCACGTDEGLAALRSGLKSRGFLLDTLKRIVVSHGHVDHYGNAQTLAEESGCEIYVHPNDVEKVCGEGRWFKTLEREMPYFVHLGVPEPTLHAMLELTKRNRAYARQVDRTRVKPLGEGQRFRFRHFEAEVLHMPGHTPGLVTLWLPQAKVLLADDHMLAKVSPNPVLDLTLGHGDTKFKALVSYCASAQRAMAMEIDCVLPGHGEAFRGHRALLESLLQFYAARQERILKRLAERGPQSAYDLIPAVFPRVDIGRMYLMLSEVLGNVEVLEELEKVKRVDAQDAVRFTLA